MRFLLYANTLFLTLLPGSGGVCFDCVRATKNSELEIIRFSNVVENRLKTKLTKQRDQVGKIK